MSNLHQDLLISTAKLKNEVDDLTKFKLAIEEVFNHVIITDSDGNIIFANKAAETMTGYSIAEMIGKKPNLWGKQMDKSYYETLWKTIKDKKQPFKGEVKNKRKNGDIYYAISTITPLVDRQDKLYGFIGVEENINALKEIDIFFETSRDLMCIANTDGYFEKINSAFEVTLGYEKKEIINNQFFFFIHPDDKNSTKDEIDKLSKGIRTLSFTNRYRRKNGEYIWLQWSATPQGSKIFATARDITKEKNIDRMKSEFISLASHQLRTPLTATKWLLERLASGEGGQLTDAQRELVQKTSLSNEEIIALVNALLNISRIESGRLMIDSEDTDLPKIVSEVIDESKTKFHLRKVSISTDIQTDIGLIKTDPKLMKNVYLNIVTNAIKYSPENTDIHVKLYKEGKDVICKVEDHGYGIPENQQDKVFGKFFRSNNITAIETEGTGLGLYLVKQIVDALGGKVGFASKENKGTTFWVSIPLEGTKKKSGEVTLSS